VGLEGELRIGLCVRDAHVTRVCITSTRPDAAGALLQGRTRAMVGAVVPRLFSICGHSQSAASELACSAAADETIDAEVLARHSATVSAEVVRESAWRMLLEWPKWIGELPSAEATAAARASLGIQPGQAAGPGIGAIALAAFGSSADEWLVQSSLAELDRWIDAGRTAVARFIRQVRDDDTACTVVRDRTAVETQLLDTGFHASWMAELAAASDSDPDFARHPTWRGAPAETGPLARRQADPLIAALMQRSTSRVPARFVARLRELALLLTGRASAVVGARALPGGGRIAWVENARGLLTHQVRFDAGRAADYRIVAPTEWNFHPDGALVRALLGVPADNLTIVKRRAWQLVQSLDPCVACHVEFEDA
jgi:coenzyme F420-reducing hydrogenase alpha subunit